MRCLEDWMKTMLVRFHDLRRFSETSSYLLIFHRTKNINTKTDHNRMQSAQFLILMSSVAFPLHLPGRRWSWSTSRHPSLPTSSLRECLWICSGQSRSIWGSWIEFAISSTISLLGTCILQSWFSNSPKLFGKALDWFAGAGIYW